MTHIELAIIGVYGCDVCRLPDCEAVLPCELGELRKFQLVSNASEQVAIAFNLDEVDVGDLAESVGVNAWGWRQLASILFH
ncbi:MAG: hypothetical protein MJY47_08660 [Fibrobacter sp.]|nr:hypothetical protein [Fibrobacter sp.]